MMKQAFFVLVAMTVIALSAASYQRFVMSSPKYMVSGTRNTCHQPIPSQPLIMNGKTYQAFSICTNGRIRLHPNHQHNEPNYVYPTVSPYYASSSYAQCRGSCILYGQTTHATVMGQVKAIINDRDFNPQAVVWIQYVNIYQLICRSSQQTNTFEVVLATDSTSVTYAIFIYRNMNWDRLCQRCSLPVVSYADSNNVGYSYTLPNTSAASHLSQSIKVFRISDKLTTGNIQEVEGADQEIIQALREMLNKNTELQRVRSEQNGRLPEELQEVGMEELEYKLLSMMEDGRIEDEE